MDPLPPPENESLRYMAAQATKSNGKGVTPADQDLRIKLAIAETKNQFAGAMVQMLLNQQATSSTMQTPGKEGRAGGTPIANPFASFFMNGV